MNENFKVIQTILPEFITQYSSFEIELLVPQASFQATDAFTMTFVRPDGYRTTELSGEVKAPQTINDIVYLTYEFKITPFHTNIIPGVNPTGTAYFSFRGTRTAEVNGETVTTDTFSSGQTRITIHRSSEPELEVFGDSELSNLQGRVQALEAAPSVAFITDETETNGNGFLFGDGSTISFVSLTKEDVGLGNVENFGIATGSDILNDEINDKYMTPATTFTQINTFVPQYISTALTQGQFVNETQLEQSLGSLAGTGLTYNTFDNQLDVTNPFNPNGDFSNLRARATTKVDVQLGNVDNVQQIPLTQKGAANGVATLDGNSRVPVAQLPLESVVFRGTFGSASSTTEGDLPATGELGDLYIADQNFNSTVAGVQFRAGDKALWDGTSWKKNEGVALEIATKEEAEAGASNVKYMSPLRTKEAIEEFAILSDGENSDILNLKFDNQSTQDALDVGELRLNNNLPEWQISGNTKHLVGQQLLTRAINRTGATRATGDPVFISGVFTPGGGTGTDVKEYELASRNTEFATFAVVSCPADDDVEGCIITRGIVRGWNTSGFTAGDDLYLTDTAGQYTTTKPTTGTIIYVGKVIRAAQDGIVFVNPTVETTKDSIGLGNVENFGIATEEEAQDGEVNNKYMTPLRTADAITAQLDAELGASNFVTDTQLDQKVASLAGTGLTFDSGDQVLNIINPFNPSGDFANLRARATTAEDVGLGNVDNESKATMFTDAALTGVPTAPTAAATTSTTQIATTAFVQSEINSAALALGTNFSVADIAARDNLQNLVVGDVVFVADDGDGKWAQYKVTAIGPVTFLKIMDQDIFLNALSAADVKAAYESNADTNAFTDALKTKLETTDVFDENGNYTGLRAQATTKEDVGLGNVTDDEQVKLADKASTAEAETGTDDTKWMTPLKTAQAIQELSPPTDVSTEYAKGVIEENNDVNLNFWVGTAAEYEDIAQTSADTLYIIEEV